MHEDRWAPDTDYFEAAPLARRRGLLVLAGIIAALLVAGAVSAVVESRRSHGSSTPVALIHAASGATTQSRTAHLTETVSITLGRGPARRETIFGDIDFATNSTELTIGGNGFSTTIRLIGGAEYFQSSALPLPVGRKWVKILPQDLGVSAAQPGLGGSGDPSQGLQFLGSTVGAPVNLGHGTVGGVSATHYSVTLDFASLFARVGQAGSTVSPRLAQGFKTLAGKVDLHHIPGSVWLDAAGRVRQFSFTLAFQVAGQAFSEVETIAFSDFGKPVHVTVPPAGETVPFSSVKDLFGPQLPGTTTA